MGVGSGVAVASAVGVGLGSGAVVGVGSGAEVAVGSGVFVGAWVEVGGGAVGVAAGLEVAVGDGVFVADSEHAVNASKTARASDRGATQVLFHCPMFKCANLRSFGQSSLKPQVRLH